MKNKLTILSIIIITLLLNGCAIKPEVTITDYFTDLQTTLSTDFKSLSIEKYFDSEVVLSENEETLNYDSGESNVMTERYIELFQGFEYTIKDTVINGDNATVNVEILTYPMGELLSNYVTQLMTRVFEWAFSGISQEEITQKTTDLFIELSTNLEKTYTNTVPVYLVKVDGKWLMAGGETNYALFNALTGGMIDFAKQFQNDMKPLETEAK